MNEYFSIETQPYINMDWVYVKTKKNLIGVIGKLENTDKFVLIKQYRPPIKKWVLSVPMGAFPMDEGKDLIEIAKVECEGETGMKISHIQPYLEYYRSPGLTDEKMILYKAVYKNVIIGQNLHPEEEIIPMILNTEEIRKIILNKSLDIDSSVLLLL
jgi:ADP-ribose pyrophosphatase